MSEIDDNPAGLGKSAPTSGPPAVTKSKSAKVGIAPELLAEFKDRVEKSLTACTSKREVLEIEVESLSECVALAAEIFKDNPTLDNAYQLSSLTTAHNTALNQLEKIKDPKILLGDLEKMIRKLMIDVVQTLMLEINKTKQDFSNLYPNDRTNINDVFARMIEAIQPQTSVLYEDLYTSLKNILGIKK